jgi:hypothetical protein
LNTRSREAGNFTSFAAGRIGRRSNSPQQFGQRPLSMPSAQERQKVHSNEQIIASGESGGRSMSQHSQPGFSKSMFCSRSSRSLRVLKAYRETAAAEIS